MANSTDLTSFFLVNENVEHNKNIPYYKLRRVGGGRNREANKLCSNWKNQIFNKYIKTSGMSETRSTLLTVDKFPNKSNAILE